MTEVGQRLKVAIEEHPHLSIAALSRALSEYDVDGSSRPSIHAYIAEDADREPSLPFLRAAAEVLDVRPEWLILGKGARTRTRDRIDEGDLRDRLAERVPTLRELPRGIQTLWADLLYSMVESAPDSDRLSGEEGTSPDREFDFFVRVSERLEWLLWFPLSQWGLRSRREMSQQEVELYVSLQLAALSVATHERGEGRSLDEIDDLLEELREGFEPRAA